MLIVTHLDMLDLSEENEALFVADMRAEIEACGFILADAIGVNYWRKNAVKHLRSRLVKAGKLLEPRYVIKPTAKLLAALQKRRAGGVSAMGYEEIADLDIVHRLHLERQLGHLNGNFAPLPPFLF